MPDSYLLLLLGVLIGAALGYVYGRSISPDVIDDSLVDFDPMITFHRQLQIACPDGHAEKGELCDLPGLWICVERFKELEITSWIDEDQEGDIYDYPPNAAIPTNETSKGSHAR